MGLAGSVMVGRLATMMSGLLSPLTSATCTDCEGDLSAPGVPVPVVYVCVVGSYSRSVPRILPGRVTLMVVASNSNAPR